MNEIFSALAGGSALAALLTLLVRATLAMLRSQGEQMREWQRIVDGQDRQLAQKDLQLAQKDRQIERLEEIVTAQDQRLAERDERIRRLEIKVAELEREVRSD